MAGVSLKDEEEILFTWRGKAAIRLKKKETAKTSQQKESS